MKKSFKIKQNKSFLVNHVNPSFLLKKLCFCGVYHFPCARFPASFSHGLGVLQTIEGRKVARGRQAFHTAIRQGMDFFHYPFQIGILDNVN
jgi:hypothetical protein